MIVFCLSSTDIDSMKYEKCQKLLKIANIHSTLQIYRKQQLTGLFLQWFIVHNLVSFATIYTSNNYDTEHAWSLFLASFQCYRIHSKNKYVKYACCAELYKSSGGNCQEIMNSHGICKVYCNPQSLPFEFNYQSFSGFLMLRIPLSKNVKKAQRLCVNLRQIRQIHCKQQSLDYFPLSLIVFTFISHATIYI